MKKLCLLFLGYVVCTLTITAQTFSYDTIPAGQVNSSKAFRYDTIRTNRQQTAYVLSDESPKEKTSSSFKKENLVIGGTFGMYFGDYTFLNISPQVGYRFNRYFTAGLGIGYSYYKEDAGYYGLYNDNSSNKDWTQNYLGGNIYAQLNPLQFLRIQVQPELYGFWGSYQPDTQMVACILVGGGFTIPTGNVGGISMMLYYDVLQSQYSPYGSQVFYSVGYTFGF